MVWARRDRGPRERQGDVPLVRYRVWESSEADDLQRIIDRVQHAGIDPRRVLIVSAPGCELVSERS